MKKKYIAALYMLLVSLCACGPTEPQTAAHSTRPATGYSTGMPTTAIELTKAEIPTNENDPYSFLVKEYYERNFSSSLSSNTNYLVHLYFALHDIDSNGTEEMLWGQDWPDGEKTIAYLYVIQSGVAVEQTELTRWGGEISEPQRVLFKNGTMRSEGSYETGELGYKYYRFEDGEIKGLLSLNIYPDGRYTRYDPTIGKEVSLTEEEYNNLRTKMESDGQLVELDWKPLAEYGR